MIDLPLVREIDIPEELVAEFEKKIGGLINILPDSSEGTHTHGGYQTGNILNTTCVDVPIMKIMNIINNTVRYKLVPYWAHYIKYNDGYQSLHTHDSNEEISFILYLNDSKEPCQTHILINKKRGISVHVNQKRGRLVIFNAGCEHYSDKCSNKEVLVGGLRIEADITV